MCDDRPFDAYVDSVVGNPPIYEENFSLEDEAGNYSSWVSNSRSISLAATDRVFKVRDHGGIELSLDDDDADRQDSKLPHLVVHPIFYQNFSKFLKFAQTYFNVIRLENLSVVRSTYVTLIGDNRNKNDKPDRRFVTLSKFYDQRLSSGSNPNVTTYYFEKDEMDMYRIEQRAPRYVLWTKDEPLPICATVLERTDIYDFSNALNRAVEWAVGAVARRSSSIVVFDLDNTLIDDSCRIMRGVEQTLRYARSRYDLMVLWSHGSSLHVDENVNKLMKAVEETYDDLDLNFDVILSNPGVENREFMRSAKNLLHLYNFFPQSRFTKAVLVDDSVYNWTPEYTEMFVPTCNDITALRDLL